MSPQVPVRRPAKREPRASQLSSISQRRYLSQKARTAFSSKGLPSVWASITARVRSDRASSRRETSMLAVSGSTSTKTGTAPYWNSGETVVGNPAATVITSSPRAIRRSPSSGAVSVMKASRLAEEPEFTSRADCMPRYSASLRSNSRV